MKELFYKLARPDGWDFFTGRTINYREAIGHTVRRTHLGEVELCSNTCLHASRIPEGGLEFATVPCSVFRVEGKPIIESFKKCGFKQFRVIEELDPGKVFKWRYNEACNPVNPLKSAPPAITEKHFVLLEKWISIRSLDKRAMARILNEAIGQYNSRSEIIKTMVLRRLNKILPSVEALSVSDTIKAAVRGSYYAYLGYILQPIIIPWTPMYPYQCAVDLWEQGLIPCYDPCTKTYELLGGTPVRVLASLKKEKIQ